MNDSRFHDDPDDSMSDDSDDSMSDDSDDSMSDDPDECELMRIVLDFERAYAVNRRLRNQHAESSVGFAGSSCFPMWLSIVALSAAIDELLRFGACLQLPPILVTRNSAPLLVALVSHENKDISAKVLQVIQSITVTLSMHQMSLDYLTRREDLKGAESLLKNLLKEGIVNQVVSNLVRLDESIEEEATAIKNSLLIFENIKRDSTFSAQNYQTFIGWMVEQLKKGPEFNLIKAAIAPTLLYLLALYDDCKIHLSEAGGMGALLQQVAFYKLVPPNARKEQDFLEEIIRCLAAAVYDCDINRQAFFDAGGVDLVKLILENEGEDMKKSYIKVSTLKMFCCVLATDKTHDQIRTKCCERFIETLGLGVLFPIFIKPKLIISEDVEEHDHYHTNDVIEKYTTGIIMTLLKSCQKPEHYRMILHELAGCNDRELNKLSKFRPDFFI